MKNEPIRLQKFMAERGVASRRKSEELITAGKVKVNGKVATIGDKVDPSRDKILVMGKPIAKSSGKMYVMLHKPRGIVTTMCDEQARKCVAELVADSGIRLFPVGRLDRNSEGILLMTNDGDFANKISHPSKHISKTYRVTIREKVSEEQLALMEAGLMLDGKKTLPCNVRVLEKSDTRTVMQIILHEGRNRQIRRMCEVLNLTIIRLKRTEIGGVKLGMLPNGRWRELSAEEIKLLTK